MNASIALREDRRRRALRATGTTAKWVVLLAGSAVMLYPLVFMILVGFFTKQEYWTTTLTLFPIAKQPTFNNYLAVFNPYYADEILRPFLLTLGITAASTLCTVVTVLVSAYAFARLRWKGQFALLFVLLATSMLPGTMTLIPRYLQYSQMHITNTVWVYLIGLPAVNIMGLPRRAVLSHHSAVLR